MEIAHLRCRYPTTKDVGLSLAKGFISMVVMANWQKSGARSMAFSRADLARRFERLDFELTRLEASGVAEEELWHVIELGVHMPTSSISDADRRWWWQQVYELFERHGLTELSRLDDGMNECTGAAG